MSTVITDWPDRCPHTPYARTPDMDALTDALRDMTNRATCRPQLAHEHKRAPEVALPIVKELILLHLAEHGRTTSSVLAERIGVKLKTAQNALYELGGVVAKVRIARSTYWYLTE